MPRPFVANLEVGWVPDSSQQGSIVDVLNEQPRQVQTIGHLGVRREGAREDKLACPIHSQPRGHALAQECWWPPASRWVCSELTLSGMPPYRAPSFSEAGPNVKHSGALAE